MEPVTHLLTGACFARAGLNRKTGLATLTLVLGSEAPDLDVILYFRGSVTGFAHHRGFTHSFLGAPLVAALVLGGVWVGYRIMLARGRPSKLPPNWMLLYFYALFGCLLHIFQDFTNNYGVRPFAPFNPRWYSWDTVFIVDPLMLIALFLGLTAPGVFSLISEEVGAGKQQFRGRGGAVTALICLAVLIFARDFEHRRAVAALESLTYQGETPLRASAFPNPLNLFSWNGVVETRDFFELVPVDASAGEVDPENLAFVRYKPEETPVTLAAKQSRLGQVYLDWAQYPVVEAETLPNEAGYLVRFSDLRFAAAPSTQPRRRSPLGAYVLLDSHLRVLKMAFGPPPAESTR